MNSTPQPQASERIPATLVPLEELIEFIDQTPAILWVGKGGVKELLEEKYLKG